LLANDYPLPPLAARSCFSRASLSTKVFIAASACSTLPECRCTLIVLLPHYQTTPGVRVKLRHGVADTPIYMLLECLQEHEQLAVSAVSVGMNGRQEAPPVTLI